MRLRHLGFVGVVGCLLMVHCSSSDQGDVWNPDTGDDAGPGSKKDAGKKKDGATSNPGDDTGDDDATTGDDDSGDDDASTGDDDATTGDDDSGPGTPGACLPKHVDNLAASINPPGGLAANQVPQFVMLGFDDNAHSDGIEWVVKTLLGNKKNKDGSPAQATFFLIGGADSSASGGAFVDDGHQTTTDVVNAWKDIYSNGHEVGVHTWDHADGGDARSLADWQTEISKPVTEILSKVGIDKCQLAGWRFPYLKFNDDGFKAIGSAGFAYDTSIEFGYDWWQPPGMTQGFGNTSPEYGKHFWWPFTLDHGLDSSFACCSKGVQAHPGVWEFPVHAFVRPDPADSTKVKTCTGLDYNLWVTKASVDPATDFCGTLKYSFDQRYNSNRSPFNAGMHSDIYSQYSPDDDTAFGNTYDVRRAALKCFVDYVLTKPDARIVTFRDVVKWLRAPTAIH